MARAAMRRLTVAAALAALLAGGVAGLARPPSQGVALAAVETEGVGADLNRALPAFGGSAPVELPPIGNPLWAIPHFEAVRDPRSAALLGVAATSDAACGARRAGSRPRSYALPSPETPPFTLVGTIIGDDSRIAIFYDQSSQTASGVRLGERASGWTVRAVEPRSATVEGSGRVVTLELPEPLAPESPASARDGSVSALQNPAPPASGTPAGRKLHAPKMIIRARGKKGIIEWGRSGDSARESGR